MPKNQTKITTSIVPKRTRQNVPPQKSNSSTTPCPKKKIGSWQSKKSITPKILTAFWRSRENSSEIKATAGSAKETDEVIPAKKSRPNQRKQRNWPSGI